MPASGLREAHFQALRTSNTSTRYGSPDSFQASREDWLKKEEKLIKEVDPSFDSSLICPVGMGTPPVHTRDTSPALAGFQAVPRGGREGSPLKPYNSSGGIPVGASGLGGIRPASGVMAEGPGGGFSGWYDSPPRVEGGPLRHVAGAREQGGSGPLAGPAFHERQPELQRMLSSSPAGRRRSMDSHPASNMGRSTSGSEQPCVNFTEIQEASHAMDLEGDIIESISIIPVDDDKDASSGQVMFSIQTASGR